MDTDCCVLYFQTQSFVSILKAALSPQLHVDCHLSFLFLLSCRKNRKPTTMAGEEDHPPWQPPPCHCPTTSTVADDVPPPHPQALPHAQHNNMLIVTSLLSLTQLPSCSNNATLTGPRPPLLPCPANATTAPTMQGHNCAHCHPTPPPMPH